MATASERQGYTLVLVSLLACALALPNVRHEAAQKTNTVTINTQCGPMQGLYDASTGLYSFMGVRFGQDTGGSARWTLPNASSCWAGTYDATSVAAKCIQFPSTPGWDDRVESEDCLFLDIYTRSLPSKGQKPLPVVYWIHGGSNLIGSSTFYGNLSNFALAYDVIVVSINYRLGLLGYLALDELAAEDPRGVSGNYGIADCLLGLQWVQKNIADFGGDPKRVMLFGQSSGGTNIFSLLATPLAKGLFHSAVALSASPNITMSHVQANAQNRQVLRLYGCDTVPSSQITKCLRAVSPQTISNLIPTCYNTDVGSLPRRGRNGVDWCGLTIADGVLVKPLLPSLREGLIDVPLIIQSVGLESILEAPPEMLNKSRASMKALLQTYFNNYSWPRDTFAKFEVLYQPYFNISPAYAYYGFLTETQFTCGLQEVARAAGQGFKSPVYISRFLTYPSKPVPSYVPGLMLPYSFHMIDYMMALKWWGFPSNLTTFNPAKSDVTVGDINLKAWYSLLWGKPLLWKSVQSTPGFPKNMNFGYFPRNSPYPQNVVNLDEATCAALSAPPLSITMNFWCIN